MIDDDDDDDDDDEKDQSPQSRSVRFRPGWDSTRKLVPTYSLP